MIFKYRAPPLALTVVFAVVIYFSSLYGPSFEVGVKIRLLVLFTGLASGITFVALGVGKFKVHKTTINPTKPEDATSLVTSGIYSITRNPMYVGFFFVLFGWALYLDKSMPFALVAIFFLYLNYAQIPAEEEALQVIFGDSYNEYKSRVRRWL